MSGDVLRRLAATIEARRGADPAGSHTAGLLARGPAKCAQKFGEEAVEAVIEAAAGDREKLIGERARTSSIISSSCSPRATSRWTRCLPSSPGARARPGLAEKAARRAE